MTQPYPESYSRSRRRSNPPVPGGLLRRPFWVILGAAVVVCFLTWQIPHPHPRFNLPQHDPLVSAWSRGGVEPCVMTFSNRAMLDLEMPNSLVNLQSAKTSRLRPIMAMARLTANLFLLGTLIFGIHWVSIWNLVRIKLWRDPRCAIPLFRGLTRRQIHSILTAGVLKQLNPGEILFEKGDLSDTMYAIVSGSLDILDTCTRDDPKRTYGNHELIKRLPAGEVVGEMGFFRSNRRAATAVATEPTELLQINSKIIKHLQRNCPTAAQPFFLNLMGTICDRLENLTRGLSDLSQVDDLTGLYNKNGFIQLLDAEASRAQRYGDDLTLCLIGVDFEKESGLPDPRTQKVMIRAICQMLAREIRRTDKLGRIDSQLFAMLAPRTSRAQAGIICQRLQKSLRQSLIGFGTVPFQIKLAASGLIRSANESAGDLLGRTLDGLQENFEC